MPSVTPLVRVVTNHDTNFLWHSRLGHINNRAFERIVAHKRAHGLPAQVAFDHALDKCPVCLSTKNTKAARSRETPLRVTECYQGVSIDFGFVVQQSKDPKRFSRLQGRNGETCFCLITDHYSGTLWGRCFTSKAAPYEFLNEWLMRYGLSRQHRCQNNAEKYVRFDGGGELGKNRSIVELFQQAGYSAEPTGPDCSHSNGRVERVNRTVADALRAILAAKT
jgi:hypothetical protein